MHRITRHAQDSCHICPNSFRVDIHQLTWTLKMFVWMHYECTSSFTREIELCVLPTLCPWLISFYPIYLNESSVELFIIPFQLKVSMVTFQRLHILLVKFSCLYIVCCQSNTKVCSYLHCFLFGTFFFVIFLSLHDFKSMQRKAVSGKNIYSVSVFASFCQ